MEKLKELIEAQRKGKKESPIWMVGEQLLDIAAGEPSVVDILKRDLEIPEMSIIKAEKKIKEWADKHKKGSCCCVSPKVADGILREFYGLPSRENMASGAAVQKSAPAATDTGSFIDLESIL